MTDLNTKFGVIGGVIETNHIELMNALDTIATALGAPPSTPTATLADVLVVLQTMVTAQAANHIALLSAVNQIATNTDLMLSNNSLNTQRLLIAIAANDPCKSCEAGALEPPPVDVTPQEIDSVHCQRMQALLYALLRFTVKLDVLSSLGLGFSPTVIHDAIAEIMTELGVSSLLEFPSVGEVAQLAGAAGAYVVSNIFSSTSLPFEFQSVHDGLLVVLYDTDSASAGQAAYRDYLNASGLSSTVVGLFKAMAYTSVFNLYFDSSNGLDVSGFDGGLCGPEDAGCTEYPFIMRADNYGWVDFGTLAYPEDPQSTWIAGDFEGWRFKLISTSHVAEIVVACQTPSGVGGGDLAIFNGPGQSIVCDRETTAVFVQTRYDNTITSGTFEVCGPGSFEP